MFGADATREKALRRQAIEEAADLFRSHGSGAVQLVTRRSHEPGLSSEDRRRLRLARVELERLEREQRRRSGRALVVWKPSLFSMAGLARLFGLQGRRRRR